MHLWLPIETVKQRHSDQVLERLHRFFVGMLKIHFSKCSQISD